VLDEPTNDLDLETLDVLDDVLLSFAGTLIVVSHDRTFLDHVVTSTIAFEGNGTVREYVGGYTDWLRQRPEAAAVPEQAPAESPAPSGSTRKADASRRSTDEASARKLTWNEQRELEELPERIAALEAEQAGLEQAMSAPDFHLRGAAGMTDAVEALARVSADLDAAMARWLDLEARAAAAQKR